MTNKKILVVGCSYTYGDGLDTTINDPKLWVNQLCDAVLPSATITNLAKVGKNNHWIFLETISALIKNDYDYVFIGWSAISRLNFHVGLELYTIDTMLSSVSEPHDISIVGGATYSRKWLNETGDRLRKIYNDHWELLNLVKYVNTLIEIQVKCRNKKIFFINSLNVLSLNYFKKQEINLPSDLSEFEQNILSTDLRDDTEIFALYDMIHQQYNEYGGINDDYWLNLNKSLWSLKIDEISKTNKHPGYLSQDIFAEYLTTSLLDKLAE